MSKQEVVRRVAVNWYSDGNVYIGSRVQRACSA